MTTVTIDLPDETFAALQRSPRELSQEMRLATAILWYTQGRISQEEAAQLAGVSQVAFIDALAAAKVPAIQVDVEELREALARDRQTDRECLIPDLADSSGTLEPSADIHTASDVGARAEPRFPPDVAEGHYQALGDWKGPRGERRAAKEFWLSGGADGACWLVRRLRDETDVETLHAAASLLADLGAISVGPILEDLTESRNPDQSLALLKALAWLGQFDSHPIIEGTQGELILAHRLQEDDADLREAAACAMRLLRPEQATRWLLPRLRDESDEYVRRVIQEELEHHHAVRT